MSYSLKSDDRCKEYFYLSADTGLLTLRKLLEDESITRFQVSKLNSIEIKGGKYTQDSRFKAFILHL